jgi:hypothetical protein
MSALIEIASSDTIRVDDVMKMLKDKSNIRRENNSKKSAMPAISKYVDSIHLQYSTKHPLVEGVFSWIWNQRLIANLYTPNVSTS